MFSFYYCVYTLPKCYLYYSPRMVSLWNSSVVLGICICVSLCQCKLEMTNCIPAEFCKTRKDGKLYPDPYDCRAYIYCSGGYAYRALCGKGLYYDEETQMCDYDFGSCAGKAVCLMMSSSNGNIFSVTGHLCGNSPVTGEFPSQRPVTLSFDVFFYLRLNKRLSKQSWGWWFETPSRPLWRHYTMKTLTNR